MRGIGPKQLASLLHGDLDWITMKALEKDRRRRYGTPSELAADITHYLDNEPVTAPPSQHGYRLAEVCPPASCRSGRGGHSFVLLLLGVKLRGFALSNCNCETAQRESATAPTASPTS